MASAQEIRVVRSRYPDAIVAGSGCWGAITECSGKVGVCLFLSESVAKGGGRRIVPRQRMRSPGASRGTIQGRCVPSQNGPGE